MRNPSRADYLRQWRADNPVARERERVRARAHYQENALVVNIKTRAWRLANSERMLELQRAWRKKQRDLVLAGYGNRCVCCAEDHPEFLSIDHVNGGGSQHRKTLKAGPPLHRWLIKNDFPPEFRLLCHNCNMALAIYGYCPHEQTMEKAI